jgi:hypothetical protein
MLLLAATACAGARAIDPQPSALRQSMLAYALTHEVLAECGHGPVDDERYATHEDQIQALLLREDATCRTAEQIAALAGRSPG